MSLLSPLALNEQELASAETAGPWAFPPVSFDVDRCFEHSGPSARRCQCSAATATQFRGARAGRPG
eukprot:59207-Pyramimonas_sp.AAC.1